MRGEAKQWLSFARPSNGKAKRCDATALRGQASQRQRAARQRHSILLRRRAKAKLCSATQRLGMATHRRRVAMATQKAVGKIIQPPYFKKII
jgi:hypothetical protein